MNRFVISTVLAAAAQPLVVDARLLLSTLTNRLQKTVDLRPVEVPRNGREREELLSSLGFTILPGFENSLGDFFTENWDVGVLSPKEQMRNMLDLGVIPRLPSEYYYIPLGGAIRNASNPAPKFHVDKANDSSRSTWDGILRTFCGLTHDDPHIPAGELLKNIPSGALESARMLNFWSANPNHKSTKSLCFAKKIVDTRSVADFSTHADCLDQQRVYLNKVRAEVQHHGEESLRYEFIALAQKHSGAKPKADVEHIKRRLGEEELTDELLLEFASFVGLTTEPDLDQEKVLESDNVAIYQHENSRFPVIFFSDQVFHAGLEADAESLSAEAEERMQGPLIQKLMALRSASQTEKKSFDDDEFFQSKARSAEVRFMAIEKAKISEEQFTNLLTVWLTHFKSRPHPRSSSHERIADGSDNRMQINMLVDRWIGAHDNDTNLMIMIRILKMSAVLRGAVNRELNREEHPFASEAVDRLRLRN